jgi:hypothetical protein
MDFGRERQAAPKEMCRNRTEATSAGYIHGIFITKVGSHAAMTSYSLADLTLNFLFHRPGLRVIAGVE